MLKVFFVAALCIPILAAAMERTLIAAADPYPPYVDTNLPGEGLAMEIVRAAFKKQGYTVKLEIMPWARAEKGVTDGRYDILVDVWRTEARAKELFSARPTRPAKSNSSSARTTPLSSKGWRAWRASVLA